MNLDWITLYDYMSFHSQIELKQKINKFYESFYPLKLKKSSKKKIQFRQIERGGLLGIIASYINHVLSVLNLYMDSEQYLFLLCSLLASGKVKQKIKLCTLFIEIEQENLNASLNLQQTVFMIQQLFFLYNGKEGAKTLSKGFLQLKLLGSLKRIFEFYYTLEQMKGLFDYEGYQKLYSVLRLNSAETFAKAKPHLQLFPEMASILQQILRFFLTEQKTAFHFHSHLVEKNKNEKTNHFQKIVEEWFSIMPNKQKQIFMRLNDQKFLQYLAECNVIIPKQTVDNYLRLEEEVNSLIAEEQNFIESILVPETYRGTPDWKISVFNQLVNISSQNSNKLTNSTVMQSKKFMFSEEFPLNNF